jgi:hypothetical protein
LDELAIATASNDIAMVGRLLGPRDIHAIQFGDRELAESPVRRPLFCSVLDVAVGSGSVEMTKCLLEFYSAKATRETLKMAISTGSHELIRVTRERLPGAEAELGESIDLVEVAAEFHQDEVLAWLFRQATICPRELLAVFALERKLSDALSLAVEGGFAPWWYRARELTLKWRVSAELEFVSAPKGFWVEGGWWSSKRGRETPLPPLGRERDGEWILPECSRRVDLTCAALPAGVRTIGGNSFEGCSCLRQLKIPLSVTAITSRAFAGCSGLTQLQVPWTVTTVEWGAFESCSGLTILQIPSAVTTIGVRAFMGCSVVM